MSAIDFLMVTMRASYLAGAAFFVLMTLSNGIAATAPGSKLIVGTKEAPPFAMKRPDGTWTGISIDLWREIASGLGRDFEFRETDLEGLLEGVGDGSLDVAVGALTITEEREKDLDFTHSFHNTDSESPCPRGAMPRGMPGSGS